MLISKSQNLWKRMGLSLSVFASLMMVATHSVASPKKGKERIAIIGSGASGITAAYLLKKQGYQNVCITQYRLRLLTRFVWSPKMWAHECIRPEYWTF